jgi:hypothetical protein
LAQLRLLFFHLLPMFPHPLYNLLRMPPFNLLLGQRAIEFGMNVIALRPRSPPLTVEQSLRP